MSSSLLNTQISVEVRNLYCRKGIGKQKTEIFYSIYNQVCLLHLTHEPQHLNSIDVPLRAGECCQG